MALKIYHYDMDFARFKFATKVYAYVICFLFGTYLQWVLARHCEKFQNYLVRSPYWSIFFMLMGLVLLMVLTNISKLRTALAINWVLFIISGECFTLGFAFALVRGPSYWFQILFFTVLIYCILIIIIATLTPFDITQFVLGVFSLMIFLFFCIIIFAIFSFVIETYLIVKIIFCIAVLLLLNVIQFYAVQVTQGGRFLELRTNELVLPVAICYYHIVIIFVLFYLIIEPETPGITQAEIDAIKEYFIPPDEETKETEEF